MKNMSLGHTTKSCILSFMLVIASMAFVIPGALAAEFCVSNATELTNALALAVANGEDDTIKVVKGTYNGNFTFISNEGHSITLLGGYNTGCITRIINPKNTILDAQHSGRVLYLYNSDGGDIIVEGLTVKNGSGTWGAGIYARSDKPAGDIGEIRLTNNLITGNITGEEHYGGGVNIYSKANSGRSANIILRDNTITGNTADWFGGGVYIMTMSYPSGDSGEITFNNNVVAGNTATVYDGGGADINSGADKASYTCGDVNFCNNTFTGNAAGRYGGGLSLSPVNGTVRVYNNIIWDNSASSDGDDIHLFSYGSPTWNGYNNDYSDMFGCSWTNSGDNIDKNPLFVSPSGGNHHIKASSPCRNAGIFDKKTYAYIGGTWIWIYYDYSFIPDDDFEGDTRNSDWVEETTNHYYKYCDIGADEYTSIAMPWIPLLLLNN